MNGMARTRPRLAAAAALAAWIAIAAGSFHRLYLTIHVDDTAPLRAFWSEVPYRRMPGLRQMLVAVDTRTNAGDRVLVWTPHRPWQGGYGYAFRRAQYVLAGREVLPLLDRRTSVIDDGNITRATYIACWRECPAMDGFVEVWRNEDSMLLRRSR
jgi:hypothetical protein